MHIKASSPSETDIRHQAKPLRVHILVCRLFDAKLLT